MRSITKVSSLAILGLLAMAGMAKGQVPKADDPAAHTTLECDPKRNECGSITFATPMVAPSFETTGRTPFYVMYYDKIVLICAKSQSAPGKDYEIVGVSDCALTEEGKLDDIANSMIEQAKQARLDSKESVREQSEYWRRKYLKELRSHIADIKKEIETHNRIIASIDKIQKDHQAPSAK